MGKRSIFSSDLHQPLSSSALANGWQNVAEPHGRGVTVGVLREPSSVTSRVPLSLLGFMLPGRSWKAGSKPKRQVIKGSHRGASPTKAWEMKSHKRLECLWLWHSWGMQAARLAKAGKADPYKLSFRYQEEKFPGNQFAGAYSSKTLRKRLMLLFWILSTNSTNH